MADLMLADRTVSATDLKKRGLASLPKDAGPVAIVKNNRATHYVVTAEVFARIVERLDASEDAELNRIADARMTEKRHRVTLADL